MNIFNPSAKLIKIEINVKVEKILIFLLVILTATLQGCYSSKLRALEEYHRASEALIDRVFEDYEDFMDVTMESDQWEDYYNAAKALQ